MFSKTFSPGNYKWALLLYVLMLTPFPFFFLLFNNARHKAEVRYCNYLATSYLPERFRETQKWPSSLVGVEQELTKMVETQPKSDADRLLLTHRQFKPRLTLLSSDAASCRGKVTFHGVFGETEHAVQAYK